MKSSPCQSAGAGRAGFSLVEVVLAVGVVAFAFVAIMGLLPAGLQQFRQAIDNSVCTQIAQRVIMDCQQTDFNTLVDYAHTQPQQNPNYPYYFCAPTVAWSGAVNSGNPGPAVRYFDEEGNEMIPSQYGTAPSPAELQNVVYWVVTRVGASTVLPTSAQSPTPHISNDLATITVQVVYNPGLQPLTVKPYVQGDPTSCLVTAIGQNQYPAPLIRTYVAQIGRNY
jgi:type II secretory pathway pseudopilin PulG